jgi:hypothetical protein
MNWLALSITAELTLASVSLTAQAAPLEPLSVVGSVETATAVNYYYRPYYRPYYYRPYDYGAYIYRPYYHYCHRYYSWGYLYCAW